MLKRRGHQQNTRTRRRSWANFAGALSLASLLFASPAIRAASLTWTGIAGDGNVFNSANWTPAQVPVTGDTLTFAGLTSLTASFGLTPASMAAIKFDATAGAFVLNGSSTLNLTSSSGITTSSTAVETVNTNLALGIAQTWTSNTGGSLTINGNIANNNYLLTLLGVGQITLNGTISGTGGLTKSSTGAGILQINGANTYTGATSLGKGTIQIGNDAAFGTGTVTFSGTSSKVEALGGARTIANAFTLGASFTIQGVNDFTFTGNGSITGARTLTLNSTGLTTFSGNIGQTANYKLTKAGTGTLLLTGTNTFTGGFGLSAGTVIAGNNNVFGSGVISLGTGMLQTQNSALVFANGISLAGNTIFAGSQDLTFNGSGSLSSNRTLTSNSTGLVTFGGAIGQTTAGYYFYKKGTGNMAFTGTAANTFTGLTNIYDGGLFLGKTAGVNAFAGAFRIGDGVGASASAFLQLNNASQIPDASALTLYNDGQFRLQNYDETIGTVLSYGGSITGTGTLGLTGTFTFSGTSGAQATVLPNVSLNGARTFLINDNSVSDVDVALTGNVIDGTASGVLTKTGPGTLSLSGANTFSGGSNLNAGTTQIGSSAALGSGTINLGDITGSSTATLLFNTTTGLTVTNAITARTGSSGTLTLGGLNTNGVDTFSGALLLNRSITVTAAAGGEVDLNGAINGVGGLTKTGAGTIKLNSTNTQTGTTTVNGGTLLLGTSDALGSGAVTITTGTLDFGANHNATVGLLTLTDGSLLGSGTSTLTTASTMLVSKGTISLILAGAGGLTKSTSNSVIVTGSNLFTGTTSVTAGTLASGAANAFSPASQVNISTGATLDLQSYDNAIASLTGSGSVALGSGILTAGGGNFTTTYTGIISGLGGFSKAGTGTMTLGAVNTYSGATAVKSGTLAIGINNAISSSSAVTIQAGATLSLGTFTAAFGSIAGGGTLSGGTGTLSFGSDNSSTTFSGTVTGSGSITKNGTGTTTLTGANNATGSLVFSGGKTVLSGSSGSLTAASGLTLRTGATLELSNTALEYGDRLNDSASVTLNGGTLSLLSDADGTFENAGQLVISTGTSSVQVTHNGGTDTATRLTFASLGSIAGGATVNFSGSGGILGAEAFGPQIFILGQAYGLLGSWATVGADAAEYSTYGVRAYNNYYEGVAGVNYNSTVEIVRLSAGSAASAKVLTNAGLTTDLGLNLTDVAAVDLGSSASRTLNLSGGSLIKSTGTATTISGAGLLTAGGTSAGNLDISVTPGSSLSISSVIANNAAAAIGLSKSDAGTLTLTGVNTFTGNVFLDGGVTNISSEANLGAASKTVIFNGGTLHLTSGFISSSGKIFNLPASQTGILDIDASQTLTLSNTAGTLTTGSAASTLYKNGAGSLIVQAANSGFSGLLQINAGRVELRNAGSLAGGVSLNGGTLALVANASTNFANALTVASDSTVYVDRLSSSGAVTQTLGAVSLQAAIWNVTGANSASLSVSAVSLAGAGTFNVTTANLTTGAITGSSSLTKTGSGRLTLSAASNYTGATLLNAGTLSQGIANALPSGTALTVASGSVFDLNGFASATGSLSGSGSVTLGSAFLTTGSTSSTYSGSLSGTGGLIKTGSGTLALTGGNLYTGATTVNGGTLSLNGASILSASTDLTVASGALLALNGNSITFASLTGAGTVALGSGSLTIGANSCTFSGALIDSGGLIKTGSGTLTLSGSSTYTGATSINAGTVIVRSGSALGAASGGITLASGAELQLENDLILAAKTLTSSGTLRNNSGNNSYTGAINLAAATTFASTAGTLQIKGNTALAGNALSVTGSGATTISGNLTGAGSLTKSGTGLLLLNGANLYTGTTTISAGTLQIASSNGLGATGAANGTSVASGATLLLDEAGSGLNVASETLSLTGSGVGGNGALRSNDGQNTWNGGITLTGNTTIQVDTDTLSLAGPLVESGGAQALTKTGAGTLLLIGTASHTGGTSVSAGTLQLDSSSRLPSTSSVAVASGATLNLDDNDQALGTLTGQGIVSTGTQTVANGGGTLTLGSGNGSATFSGNLQGAGDLEKNGTGTQILAAINDFTGDTEINGGKLEAAADRALGATSSLQVNTGGTLLLSGASATDRINNTAALTLAGGTLARSTGSEGVGASRSPSGVISGSNTLGLGALTLATTSTIDFGTGAAGTLVFSSLATGGFTLNILNYSLSYDNNHADGQSDRLIFNQDVSASLGSISFGATYSPAMQISLGNGYYEVTAVPEPSTWLGAFFLTALAGAESYRRRKTSRKAKDSGSARALAC